MTKLSIIIPAYNEQKRVGACVRSVREATAAIGRPDWAFETIVANNNSTDATARLASEEGATVVFEPINHISRARNAGAAIASGAWFLFIDADSVLHPQSLSDLLDCIARGKTAGGGGVVKLDGASLLVRTILVPANWIMRFFRFAPGSFIFCRADAFRDIGGFSLDVYAGEELLLSRALQQWGRARGLRFTILTRQPHVSSARKFELYSRWEILKHCCRAFFMPWQTIRNREKLEFFYDGRR